MCGVWLVPHHFLHEFVEVTHECLRLYIQLAEHIISTPTADQIDDIYGNSGTEECHGTCGVEETSWDILGFESQVWDIEHEGVLEGLGCHGRRKILASFYCCRGVG